MVSSVMPRAASTNDKRTTVAATPRTDPPGFDRTTSSKVTPTEAKASRTYGGEAVPFRSTAGFVRSATAARTKNKDAVPGMLGDVAGQTWNSGVAFVGTGARWAVQRAPTPAQIRSAAADFALFTAGTALIGAGMSAVAYPFEEPSQRQPALNVAIFAGMGASMWTLAAARIGSSNVTGELASTVSEIYQLLATPFHPNAAIAANPVPAANPVRHYLAGG